MINENLLFSRLRSIRNRKRNSKKDVEKQIRKKYKRSKELWKLRRNVLSIPLERPYQKGFVRFFVVRDDVKRSKDGDFFEGILNKINTYMYSESRKFLKKKRKFGRKIYIEKEQKLYRIFPWQWEDPKFGLTVRERQYFVRKENDYPLKKTSNIYYEFIEPWRFALRVRPYMITHYKPLDLELEKEYDEINSYIKQYKIEGFIRKKIYGKSDKWRFDDQETHLIESARYFHYKMSATQFADYFMDL